MTATLAEIAAHAGVSQATVSRVLNEKPGVAPEKRRAVLTSLDLLGYERPSRLRTRTARPVGLLLPELGNPVFPAFAQALAPNFARRGFTPMIGAQSEGGLHEDEVIDMFVEAGVAGILFVAGRHADTAESTERYRRLRDGGLPLGFVNGHRDDIDAPFFSLDDLAAMSLAVRHLTALGHRRIGLAAGPETLVSSQRGMEGFERAVREALGATASARVVHALISDDGGVSAARSLIGDGCTAIICASDLIAIGVLSEARRQGLRVPEDLSVVGLDDSILARSTWPPLTTIRQPIALMGIAVADAFVGEMNGIPASRTEYLFQPELVLRESTGPARS